MLSLWQMCAQVIAHNTVSIDISLSYRRGFEHNYKIHQCGGTHGHANFEDPFGKDNLFWSLSCLGHDEFRRIYAQHPCFNFQVLDHLLSKADFKERNRISDRLLQEISDIAVLDEVRMSLAFDRRYNDRPESSSGSMPDYFLLHSHLCERWDTREPSVPCGLILESLCTKYKFPIGKMENSWLDQASAARNEPNRLWQVIRAENRKQLEQLKAPRSFLDRQCKLMSAEHDEEHVEERQMEEFAVHQALKKAAELKAQMNFEFATTPSQTIWGSENSNNNAPQKRIRTVAKTRQTRKFGREPRTRAYRNFRTCC